jgi:hypothetical protein
MEMDGVSPEYHKVLRQNHILSAEGGKPPCTEAHLKNLRMTPFGMSSCPSWLKSLELAYDRSDPKGAWGECSACEKRSFLREDQCSTCWKPKEVITDMMFSEDAFGSE